MPPSRVCGLHQPLWGQRSGKLSSSIALIDLSTPDCRGCTDWKREAIHGSIFTGCGLSLSAVGGESLSWVASGSVQRPPEQGGLGGVRFSLGVLFSILRNRGRALRLGAARKTVGIRLGGLAPV